MIVRDGQNIVDIALMLYGNSEAVFDIAQENSISVSEVLRVGQEIRAGGGAVNADALSLIQSKGFIINTGVKTEAQTTQGFGFGFTLGFGSSFNA